MGKPAIDAVAPMDPEPLDRGKQTKSIHVRDGIVPPGLSVDVNGKGVIEIRDNSDVPGVIYKSACAEAAGVVYEIGNDHFDDLQGKFGGRGIVCWRSFWRNTP